MEEQSEKDQVLEYGEAILSREGQKEICLLSVIGEIEGHENLGSSSKTTKYEHILPKLAKLEDSSRAGGLLLLINTQGGDVSCGLALAEMVASLSKPTVSLVIGDSHSIGVPLAVAPKVSMIVPSASMTIHPVRMNGTVIAAPQTFNYFERIQERIVTFVAKNSRISKKKFLGLMLKTGEMAADVGSVIYGEEAVELGLIDRIGGLSDALDCLYEQIAEARKEQKRTASEKARKKKTTSGEGAKDKTGQKDSVPPRQES